MGKIKNWERIDVIMPLAIDNAPRWINYKAGQQIRIIKTSVNMTPPIRYVYQVVSTRYPKPMGSFPEPSGVFSSKKGATQNSVKWMKSHPMGYKPKK